MSSDCRCGRGRTLKSASVSTKKCTSGAVGDVKEATLDGGDSRICHR